MRLHAWPLRSILRGSIVNSRHALSVNTGCVQPGQAETFHPWTGPKSVAKRNRTTQAATDAVRIIECFDAASRILDCEFDSPNRSKECQSLSQYLGRIIALLSEAYDVCKTDDGTQAERITGVFVDLWWQMHHGLRSLDADWYREFLTDGSEPRPELCGEPCAHLLVFNLAVSIMEILSRNSTTATDWFRLKLPKTRAAGAANGFYLELRAELSEWRSGPTLERHPALIFHQDSAKAAVEDIVAKNPKLANAELLPVSSAQFPLGRTPHQLLFDKNGVKRAAREIGRLRWFNYVKDVSSPARPAAASHHHDATVDSGRLKAARKNARPNLIHSANEDPPAKFRRDAKPDGDPIGPVRGNRTELGFALHRDDNLTDQQYRKHFLEKVSSGAVWARFGVHRRELQMFVMQFPDRNLVEDRLTKFRERNSTKPKETRRNQE